MGLARLGRVAFDGRRFKANTSKHKAMSDSRMDRAMAQIREELAKLKADLEQTNAAENSGRESSLPDEIKRREDRLAKIKAAKEALAKDYADEAVPETAQKSFADHDAMPMAKQGDAFQYGYNCQAAVDGDNQIIVAAALHDAPNDYQSLPGMLAQTKENCGAKAEAVLADTGYRSGENLAAIEAHGSTPYVALAKGEDPATPDVRACIAVTIAEDGGVTVRCPVGQEMSVKTKHADGSIGVRLPKRACRDCPMRDQCPLQRLTQKTIHLLRPEYFVAVMGNHARKQSEEGRDIYRRRKVIVESVFGNIKNKGMKILVRGKSKVRTWWRMACTAHNLEKVVSAMQRNAVAFTPT